MTPITGKRWKCLHEPKIYNQNKKKSNGRKKNRITKNCVNHKRNWYREMYRRDERDTRTIRKWDAKYDGQTDQENESPTNICEIKIYKLKHAPKIYPKKMSHSLSPSLSSALRKFCAFVLHAKCAMTVKHSNNSTNHTERREREKDRNREYAILLKRTNDKKVPNESSNAHKKNIMIFFSLSFALIYFVYMVSGALVMWVSVFEWMLSVFSCVEFFFFSALFSQHCILYPQLIIVWLW